MKFMLKFVCTQEIKEFYSEMHSLVSNLKDKESLVEGVHLLFCMVTLYFLFTVFAF